jgi:hypothetical protein
MNYLWTEGHFGDAWYRKIQAHHIPLWSFVNNFIKQHKVQSIFEVGGGPAPLRSTVSKYTNVDVNEKYRKESTQTFKQITADFSTLNVLNEETPDLFLGMGVVEHCEHYNRFIEKALSLNPKYIIISFFFGLDRNKDEIRKRMSGRGVDGCQPYWINRYSKAGLEEFLTEKGILNKSYFISLPCSNGRTELIEDVLIINLRSEANFARNLNNIMEGLK